MEGWKMALVQIVMFSFAAILIYESLKPVVSKFVDSFKKDKNVKQNDN